jgi:hypothetical protein
MPDSNSTVGGYTPGPWLADFHNEEIAGGRFVTYVRGGNQLVPIAAVPTGVEGYGREEGRANARVIAAAPDLLAACEYQEHIQSTAFKGDPAEAIAKVREMRRAAIAKATGGQS